MIFQFRPIALCNTVVKILTKVLANLLKPLMNKLTDVTQSGFIPGCQGTDNTIVVQEILHSMRKRKG